MLEINGYKIANGKGQRQGLIRDTDGNQQLIIWLKLNSEEVNHVTLNPL
jgi:hypothetical protein